ncbi:MAG: APC family permease, partial [Candidatus Promineifilaceae bacterium]|nr:APC family permease [Candidatus Promineifilaceae bacterium]
MDEKPLRSRQDEETSQKGSITMWGAVFLGIGSMVGAGIFTLLGQAGKIAGSAVWISFVIGGIIALLCGYSFAKLGVRYPSRGGLVEYITQAFGSGTFTGGSSILFYIANIVAMAMIASSFGEYCALLIFGEGYPQIWVNILASLLVVGLTAVNFIGAETVSKAETIIVLFKLAVLAIFTVATVFLLDSSKLAPSTWPSFNLILASLALTFLAYAGFNVIGNTAEDMDNPQRDIPRAMYT